MTGRPLKLGVVAATMSADPREAAAASRAAGFAGLLIDAISPTLNVTELSQTGRREFAQVLRSNDQQLVGLRAEIGGKGLTTGVDIDRILSGLGKIIEAAKGLSPTPMVVLDVGPLPQPAADVKQPPRVTPEQAGLIIIPEMKPAPPQESRPVPGPDPALLAQVDNALRELCALADRVGGTVALSSDLASFAALDRALAAVACPWLAVDLDPIAMLHDDWTADEIFSRLGSQIRHVRGRDALAGADKRTKPAPIGRGSIDWPKLLSDLDAASYRGWITIDPLELTDRRAAAIAGLAHLRTFAP
jgi:sugar phosphate isomerase/epimerase